MEIEYDKDFVAWFQNKPRVKNAIAFAEHYHKDQFRNYDKRLPYVVHPIAVATKVWQWGGSIDEVIAAILHDTVEETKATIRELEREFGIDVAQFVYYQTPISKLEDGTRAVRKQMDNEHYATGPLGAKRGKFADTSDNIKDLVEKNPKFAKTYFKEKWDLIHLLYEPALKREFFSVRRSLLDEAAKLSLTLEERPLQEVV